MGAGSGSAGVGLAGVDPLPLSVTPGPMTGAAQYDPRTRTLVMNADGTIATVDPVDQEVAFCLTIKKGTISSNPTRGFDWDRLRATPSSSRAHAATDLVKLALRKPLSRGDITIISVQLFDSPGRLGLITTYANNRLAGAPQTPFSSAFTG